MNRIGLLAALLTTLGVFNVCGQGLIWSAGRFAEVGVGGGAPPYVSWQISFDAGGFEGAPSLNPVSSLFTMSLFTNDTGRTFVANALNEPGFAGFVANLTDGTNGAIRFQRPNISSWQSASEQLFLGRSPLAPDLAGYNITEVHFRVVNFYDTYSEQDNIYGKHLDYSLDFYGAAVPEPGTWALLGLGGAAALLLRRKARKPR